MAEEEKTESKADETIDLSKVVDSAMAEKSEVETEKDGKSEEEKPQKSNDGWLTSLPKELRDGVDTTRFSSLGEYVKSLKENQKEDQTVTKEAYDTEWSVFQSELENSAQDEQGKAIARKLAESFKSKNLKASDVKAVLETYVAEDKSARDEENATKAKQYNEYIKNAWGKDMKANFSMAERGIREMAGKNKALLQMIQSEHLENHPAIMEMFKEIGSKTSEASIGRGGQAVKTFDPSNPLGF